MKTECLDYAQLSGYGKLFIHFLYGLEPANRFYTAAHHSLEDLKKRCCSIISSSRNRPRRPMNSLLREFNQSVGCGELTLQNIDSLQDPESIAVVTGQQVGLFGGPAFSVYKAITAIKTCSLLQREGVKAVPIFWLASDDSDFQEARSTFFYSTPGELIRLSHPGPPRNTSRMVGTIGLDSLQSLLSDLCSSRTDLSDSVLQLLKNGYGAGKTFGRAFANWLAALFRDQGLILFDPLLGGYKRLLLPCFEIAIEKRAAIVEALALRAELLQQNGFSPQVHTDETESLLFLIEGDRRFKLEFRNGCYVSKDLRGLSLTPAALLERIRAVPECAGPNVLLRPLLQDALFPTAVYVGGPSEIAYFAQISAIAHFWDLEPSAFPRAGFTIVDHKSQRLLKKYGIDVSDVIQKPAFDLARRIVEKTDLGRLIAAVEDLGRNIEQTLDHMSSELQSLDPTISEMTQHSQQKISYQLEKIKRRVINNFRRREQLVSHHLSYLSNHLLPEKKMQERVINFNHLLIQEGPEILPKLLDCTHPFCKCHQILYV
ncbi:MAG: bacillithiol biosynthesis cysteine-adding enzyme BshC [Acidobacteria bacterium]|nr:bacillithiol biosynthesis cysteine-adding enzyme BshC [Acidobacteriota bacterium]